MSSPKLLLVCLVVAIQLLGDGEARSPPVRYHQCKRHPKNLGSGKTFANKTGVKIPGLKQPIKPKGKIDKEIDLLFIIDKSKRINAAAFKNEQNFLLKIVDSLVIGPKNVQVALIEFWSEAYPMFNLNEYTNEADLREYIQKGIGCEGCQGKGAKLAESLTSAAQEQLSAANGMRANSLKFIVIVTNEVPEDEGRVKQLIAPLKAMHKMKLIVCGVGGDVNEKNVGYLASSESMALFYNTFAIFELKAPPDVIKLLRPPSLKAPIDLAIVMDVSAAGTSKHAVEAMTFLRGVVDEFVVDKPNIHVALVTYGSKIQLQWDFNKYTDNEKLDKALADFKCSNCKAESTEAGDALEFCRRHVFISETGSRIKSKKIVMLFSDSKAGNEAKLQTSAQLLADSIHAVVAIGVGQMVTSQLKVIASHQDLAYHLSDFTDLQGTADLVATKIYKYTLLPLPKCSKKLDMLVIMDRSGSLSEENYNQEKQFVEGVVQELDVSPAKVLVGMEMFAVKAYPQWGFNKYKDATSLMQAVSTMKCKDCKRFKTSTAKALEYGIKEMSNAGHGARSDAKKVVVVLTDGHSTDLSSKMAKQTSALKAKYKVIAIGVGDITKGANGMKELQQIASGPQYVDTVPKFVNLPYISRFTAMEICHAAG